MWPSPNEDQFLKLYQSKQLKFGFIILCPEHTIPLLKQTVNSIVNHYRQIPYVCVTDETASKEDLEEMKAICPTYKAGKTYSSLINLGMKKAPAEWNFLVCAGSTMRANMDRRFSCFVEGDGDILYPIAERKCNFVDGTINGLFLNKKMFKKVGDMAETCPWDICKTIWAAQAIDVGCRFKAIANCKIC